MTAIAKGCFFFFFWLSTRKNLQAKPKIDKQVALRHRFPLLKTKLRGKRIRQFPPSHFCQVRLNGTFCIFPWHHPTRDTIEYRKPVNVYLNFYDTYFSTKKYARFFANKVYYWIKRCENETHTFSFEVVLAEAESVTVARKRDPWLSPRDRRLPPIELTIVFTRWLREIRYPFTNELHKRIGIVKSSRIRYGW